MPVADRTLGGRIVVVAGADPAAGAEILKTVPAGKRWVLLSMHFNFVTDATAANRQVHIELDSGGANTFGSFIAEVTQPASISRDYTAAEGQGGITGGIALPARLELGPGFRINTVTNSLQTGDNFGAPVFYVLEFDEVAA